jgi:hypothetical protein
MKLFAKNTSQSAFQDVPQHGDSRDQQLCDLLSLSLHEPAGRVRRLLKSHSTIVNRLERQRNHYIGEGHQKSLAASFYLPRKSTYLDFLNTDNKSRVVATFHLGDYVYGLNHLMSLENPKRNRIVLNHREGSFPYRKNVLNRYGNRALDRKSQLLSQHCNTAKLAATLREKPSTLILFSDLPHHFGKSIEVEFLGRRAWFVRGPAVLAITARAPILPVVNFMAGNSNTIEIKDLIDSTPRPGESFSDCVHRLTQALCSILESYLRSYPEQWRYLNHMALFFQDPEGAGNI